MTLQQSRAWTKGASHFEPDALFDSWNNGKKHLPEDDDLKSSIISTFNLPRNDSYVYHATASVTLSQVQEAINHGSKAGLHAWYLDDEKKPLPPPPPADISAYTSIFSPNTATSKLLTGFAANAKKGSIRSKVASHLKDRRVLPQDMTIPRSKDHINLYYDFWCWSCQNLEWAGPEDGTANIKTSHHILPIFMHHFGCVVPSYESLQIIKRLSGKRSVVEIGSGNGYWTYMLRRMGVLVQAVDNQQSEYRTLWIGDTLIKDGVKHIKDQKACKENVLLLVYPIVSSDFTSKVLDAHKGDTICVAGTQNRNGYTAFKDRTIEEYMKAEKADYEKIIQIPLPSFPGKDEALYVFERRGTQGK